MLLAITSYPFQPRQLLLAFNWTFVLGVVATTFAVFVQMERDTVLSVLSESEPGQVNWSRDFISRLFVYIALPIGGLLTAQFPEATRTLLTWAATMFGGH